MLYCYTQVCITNYLTLPTLSQSSLQASNDMGKWRGLAKPVTFFSIQRYFTMCRRPCNQFPHLFYTVQSAEQVTPNEAPISKHCGLTPLAHARQKYQWSMTDLNCIESYQSKYKENYAASNTYTHHLLFVYVILFRAQLSNCTNDGMKPPCILTGHSDHEQHEAHVVPLQISIKVSNAGPMGNYSIHYKIWCYEHLSINAQSRFLCQPSLGNFLDRHPVLHTRQGTSDLAALPT